MGTQLPWLPRAACHCVPAVAERSAVGRPRRGVGVPFSRGRLVGELGSSGRVKRSLDVLFWGGPPAEPSLADLNEVEMLREFLRETPGQPGIRYLVPVGQEKLASALRAFDVAFEVVSAVRAGPEALAAVGDPELADAVQTGLAWDADALVVDRADWLPWAPGVDRVGLLLTDTSFLMTYCEIFVRGHDVPWAFSLPYWQAAWTGFYQITERETFRAGMEFLWSAYKSGASAEAQETGRSFVHNRLPNICFTRDRLFFYETQRMAARRAGWRRQEFTFEIGYYLNFYYMLLFGGFDHIALLVNQSLALGLPDDEVGATYRRFLDRLGEADPELHAAFTDARDAGFMKRVAALRHYASHRGMVAPGKLIVRNGEMEPSEEELDAMIAEAGYDELLEYVPEGDLRDGLRESIRATVAASYLEQKSEVVDGVVPIAVDGARGLIHPLADTDWNFGKFGLFARSVFNRLNARLSTQTG